MINKPCSVADVQSSENWCGSFYSDTEAFLSGEGVCYIPEYADSEDGVYISDHCYTREDLKKMVSEFFPERSIKNKSILLDDLFERCVWAFPDTVLHELG